MMNAKQSGRKTAKAPRTNIYYIRLTDEENARFLTMYEQSGCTNKARFIRARIFG